MGRALQYIILFLGIALTAGNSEAFEIESAFAAIRYESREDLHTFNDRLHMGRLRYLMRGRKALTAEDEVKNKIDVITSRVREILAMYPPHLFYSVDLVKNQDGIQELFLKLHNVNLRRPAFYYPPGNVVYISVRNTRLKVMAHEIGHVVVENYFKISPPVKIHELLAQFAERHITD